MRLELHPEAVGSDGCFAAACLHAAAKQRREHSMRRHCSRRVPWLRVLDFPHPTAAPQRHIHAPHAASRSEHLEVQRPTAECSELPELGFRRCATGAWHAGYCSGSAADAGMRQFILRQHALSKQTPPSCVSHSPFWSRRLGRLGPSCRAHVVAPRGAFGEHLLQRKDPCQALAAAGVLREDRVGSLRRIWAWYRYMVCVVCGDRCWLLIMRA
jgi:hypothetical protein